ncbi:hypothetical protein MICCA_2930004 [Microcystis aeruginosa PCC 9432]|jgi:hypothetical protein|uniref:Uncharacterized protein n=2 Tax=Microcystis aeruginosa TaxID=1126 RepID=A0A822L9U8_MICAE|nr:MULTISPECIES: hypothetical protein [Microcystis]MCZ8243048.1 hypothetical protein [Microcystis sp. LE19-131.1A]CCH93333.1 hypothetical protein MICCA_2930004 [Microcystis aeruginosa PCC 9432]CCI24020.1 hypothetical protein MICAG_2330005 [Microcystis aeruginosa PCC 9808]
MVEVSLIKKVYLIDNTLSTEARDSRSPSPRFLVSPAHILHDYVLSEPEMLKITVVVLMESDQDGHNFA